MSVSSGPFAAVYLAPGQVHGPRCLHPPALGTTASYWWIIFSSGSPFALMPLTFFFSCFEIRSSLEITRDDISVNTRNLTTMKVDKLIIHPHYDKWFLDNDIALVLLESPFNLGVNIVPICLSEVTNIRRWRNCWVSGWGLTSELL